MLGPIFDYFGHFSLNFGLHLAVFLVFFFFLFSKLVLVNSQLGKVLEFYMRVAYYAQIEVPREK